MDRLWLDPCFIPLVAPLEQNSMFVSSIVINLNNLSFRPSTYQCLVDRVSHISCCQTNFLTKQIANFSFYVATYIHLADG